MNLLLISGGAVLCLVSFFPISVSDWLPRSIQFLVGSITLLAGVCLTEVKAYLAERDRAA